MSDSANQDNQAPSEQQPEQQWPPAPQWPAPEQQWARPTTPEQQWARPTAPEQWQQPAPYGQPQWQPAQSGSQPTAAPSPYATEAFRPQSYSPSYLQQSYAAPGPYAPSDSAEAGQDGDGAGTTQGSKKGPFFAALGLVVVVVAGLLVWLTGAVVSPPSWTPQWLFHKDLSHTAVEQFTQSTESNLGQPVNVQCNDGKNVRIDAGRTFACTADGGHVYTVTIENGRGRYRVTQTK